MKYRKLRIAWSVLWGVACLLLIVMWVRSYSYWDILQYPYGQSGNASAVSVLGAVQLAIDDEDSGRPYAWRLSSRSAGDWIDAAGLPPVKFDWRYRNWFIHLAVPHWIAVAITVILTTAPWLLWRYSLRTLLIAMTVAAVGMGVVVYALRR